MALRPQHIEQKQAYVDDSCKLLLHMNGVSGNQQFIDSSNSPKVVTPYGNACLSNSHYRFGGTSGYFDGSGDYLLLNGDSDFAFGGENFTICGWIYLTTISIDQVILGFRPTSTQGLYPTIYVNSINKIAYYIETGERITGTTSLSATTWYHFALIRDGGNVKLYLNGIQEGSTYSDSGTYLCGANRPVIGISDYSLTDAPMHCYMDELTIWKGIAKPIGELYPQLRPYGYPIGGT